LKYSGEELTLGFDTVYDYEEGGRGYFGATIGRYANRISRGQFTLQGKTYQLAQNNNNINHLHGGVKGFDKVVWTAKPFHNEKTVGVEFQHLSKDTEEGYPGNLNIKVRYELTEQGHLSIDYEATTDQETPVNFTNHTF